MKHVQNLSKSMPAKAFLPEGHPSITDSLKGLIEDPMATIQTHLNKGE